mmetsp:Transcript_7285/g.21438  ORF Transcript_7285/g.21438 Transcript_7285/m.21438 type:complete len:321 (+) Transcript_7285:47-1009(+)
MPKKPAPAAAPEPPPPQEDPGYTLIPGTDWEPPKMLIRPADQLPGLSEKELAEEVTRVWKADNPEAAHNLARFSNAERVFKYDPTVEQAVLHFAQEGPLVNASSDEAKEQLSREEAATKTAVDAEEGTTAADGGDEAAEDDARGLRNQFNFAERTCQTLNYPQRERGTMTEPPPSVEYAGAATQWDIFDAYMEDMDRKREAEKKASKKSAAKERDAAKKDDAGEPTGKSGSAQDLIEGAEMGHATQILERMVNQNTYDDITMDFKFWEDASDMYREGEGTLLPLWKFQTERTKRKHVTAVRWNPAFPDLFAVGYGSHDFF